MDLKRQWIEKAKKEKKGNSQSKSGRKQKEEKENSQSKNGRKKPNLIHIKQKEHTECKKE